MKEKTVIERVELLYNVLKNFQGRQIKSLNVKECQTIIEAYGDETGELKNKKMCHFLDIGRKLKNVGKKFS